MKAKNCQYISQKKLFFVEYRLKIVVFTKERLKIVIYAVKNVIDKPVYYNV